MSWFYLDPENLEMTLRVALALILGAIPGLEREYHRSPAGLRTHMLVAGGAACFTLASVYGFDQGDPGRVAAQIVSGVGFLGAGTIWMRDSGPGGLTTAAGIWMVAAIGMLMGLGMYWLAISSSVLLLLTLWLLRFVRAEK